MNKSQKCKVYVSMRVLNSFLCGGGQGEQF